MTPTKTYEVTGKLTPDATGTYEDAGEHGGKRYYQRFLNDRFLWCKSALEWYISETLGVLEGSWWSRIDPNIEGDYQPGGDAIGVATVTEI